MVTRQTPINSQEVGECLGKIIKQNRVYTYLYVRALYSSTMLQPKSREQFNSFYGAKTRRNKLKKSQINSNGEKKKCLAYLVRHTRYSYTPEYLVSSFWRCWWWLIFLFFFRSFPFSISIWTSFVSSSLFLAGTMLSPRFRFLLADSFSILYDTCFDTRYALYVRWSHLF